MLKSANLLPKNAKSAKSLPFKFAAFMFNTGDVIQETGDRTHKTGDRETGDMRQETGRQET